MKSKLENKYLVGWEKKSPRLQRIIKNQRQVLNTGGLSSSKDFVILSSSKLSV